MKYIVLTGLLLLACGGTKTEKKVETPVDTTPKTPYMNIQVKDYGTIVIQLFPQDAPNNVKSVSDLATKGFYNGLIFHRIIKGFVIQGGCPNGDGTGNPGYEIDDEISPVLRHNKYTVAMANAGPNTNGSQFYICLQPLPNLDAQNRYTIIGTVTEGQDVVDKIGLVKTNQSDRPLKDVVMEKVWIEEK
jgi:cyclophilin family peptidyl-prolyl cis-trans isomerase